MSSPPSCSGTDARCAASVSDTHLDVYKRQPSSLGTLYEAIAGDRTITGEIFRASGPDEPVSVDLIDTDDPARDFGLMAILQYERAYCAYPEEDFYHQEPDVTVALTFGDGTGVSINWYRSEPSLILVTDDETGRKDCYATGLSLDYYMELSLIHI